VHPEGLCLELGAGCGRLADSTRAPPARARIWTSPGTFVRNFPSARRSRNQMIEA